MEGVITTSKLPTGDIVLGKVRENKYLQRGTMVLKTLYNHSSVS